MKLPNKEGLSKRKMKELFQHKDTIYFDCLKEILIEKSCEGILKTSDNCFCQWGYPRDKLKIKNITITGEEAVVKIEVVGVKKLKSFRVKVTEI